MKIFKSVIDQDKKTEENLRDCDRAIRFIDSSLAEIKSQLVKAKAKAQQYREEYYKTGKAVPKASVLRDKLVSLDGDLDSVESLKNI